MLLLFLLTFIQGLFSAPTTTDSMVYHLPRIMFWMQEKTLYQNVIRNSHDFMAPFGEYLTLHLYFITGNDRLLFFSQWFSYIASVILSTVIAKKFLIDSTKLIYLAILVATLPIAVLQASSTQTDLVTTLMVLLSIYYAFSFREQPNLRSGIALGASIGLGILTKATFVIYSIMPLGIIILALVKYRKNITKIVLPLLFCAFVIILLQLRFINQNLSLYGTISGQPIIEKGGGYTNETISWDVIASNVIRNSFINLPIPFINNQVQSIILGIHKLIRIDMNDPRTTYSNTMFLVAPIISPQEDIAASPLHFLLIILGGLYLLLNWRNLKDYKSNLLYMYFLSILSFILLSLILKWQPFHPRLQIPFLLMGSISSFLILEKVKILRLFLRVILGISVVLALVLILLNVSKPFISYSSFYRFINQFSLPNTSIPEAFYSKPRESQYFNARFYWYSPYENLTKGLEGEDGKIKISFELMDDFEYPLWVFLGNKKINYQIIPLTRLKESEYLLKTSEKIEEIKSFAKIACVKTSLEYGYACLYKRI